MLKSKINYFLTIPLLTTLLCFLTLCTNTKNIKNQTCTPVELPEKRVLLLAGTDSIFINAGVMKADKKNYQGKSIDIGSSAYINKNILYKIQEHLTIPDGELSRKNVKAMVLFGGDNLEDQINLGNNLLAVGVIDSSKRNLNQNFYFVDDTQFISSEQYSLTTKGESIRLNNLYNVMIHLLNKESLEIGYIFILHFKYN